MKKRLRKKLHRGEFNWLGFDLQCSFEPALSDDDDLHDFLDKFMNYIEFMNLGCGGSTSPTGIHMQISKILPVRRMRNGKVRVKTVHCTTEDQRLLTVWLKRHAFVQTVETGPLYGMWR